jgi:hypothetical protein
VTRKASARPHTVIYLNRAMHYPNGFYVSVLPSNGTAVNAESNYITVTHNVEVVGEGSTISIDVTPNQKYS